MWPVPSPPQLMAPPAAVWGMNNAQAMPLPVPRRRKRLSQASQVFKVRLRDFACEDLTLDGRCDVCLKVDFGGSKVFRTSSEPGSCNPQFRFQAGFDFALDASEKLCNQEFRVECCSSDGRVLGEAAIDLETLACGSPNVRLTLHDPAQGAPRGAVSCVCVFQQRAPALTVTCGELQLSDPSGAPAPASLQVTCTLPDAGGGTASLQLPHCQDGSWPGPCSLVFGATLGDLLRAPAKEGLRFTVMDEAGSIYGVATLAFRALFSPQPGDELPFRLPVLVASSTSPVADMDKRLGCTACVAELEGVLRYQNLPQYAQMVGGLSTDGQVEGGWLLIDGLPFPRCLQKPPPVWREPEGIHPLDSVCQDLRTLPAGDRGGGTSRWSLDSVGQDPRTAQAAGSAVFQHMADEETLGNSLASRQFLEALEQIELPPPWEQHQERSSPGRFGLNGRSYFADPRSRRTTWKDPRFLPESWEQCIDPQTGRVYFRYHRARQTTFVDPRGCPLGWEMRLSKQGDAFFAYRPEQKTTFVDPRGLPEQVEAALDNHGRMFFKDHAAKSCSWQDPRDGRTDEVLSQWRAEEFARWWQEQVWTALEDRAMDDSGKMEFS